MAAEPPRDRETGGEPELSVVIPAYNEAAAIGDVIRQHSDLLTRIGVTHEILVIDDGSADATLAQTRPGDVPSVRAWRHEANRGISRTLLELYAASRGRWVYYTPADGQIPAAALELLWAARAEHACVVGERRPRQDPPIRRLMAWAYSVAIRSLFRVRVRDIDSVKLIDGPILRGLTLTSTTTFVEAEILIELARAGHSIAEVAIPHLPRRSGTARGASLQVIAGALADLCRFAIRSVRASGPVVRGPRTRELPRHEVIRLGPRASRYAVVIPVWNEGHRLSAQLVAMRPYLSVCDIVIADSSSTDGSTSIEVLGASGVRALVKVYERGVSLALRPAIAHVLDEGYEGLILMDGNGKDDPKMLARFGEALASGVDYAQGSRYLAGGAGLNTPRTRDLLIRYVHSPLFSLACGRRFTDSTVGSRAFSRRLLSDERVRPFRSVFRDYDLYFYLGWAACRFGFRVADVPVTRAYPESGEIPTKITLRHGYWQMLRPLFLLLTRRY